MILAPLVGATLVISVSVEAGGNAALSRAPAQFTTQQKNAIMEPLVRTATDCISQAVAADPRTRATDVDMRDVIVATMPSCADQMRAMIDAHDRLFGEGTGETFFMGPYLDTLPSTVVKAVKATAK